jgi:uncharacterized protein (DUF433 family)
MGRRYPTSEGEHFFRPVFATPDRNKRELSFVNLVEAHVLAAIRAQYNLRLDRVRDAMDYVRKAFGSQHPLAEHRFQTNGVDLFVVKFEQLINVTRQGQLAMKQVLEASLRRIEWDASGIACQLYPFTRRQIPDAPKAVLIDPRVSFGRPVLAGTGIATAIVAERYKAGEDIDILAQDYDRARSDIEEAIRCELHLDAA